MIMVECAVFVNAKIPWSSQYAQYKEWEGRGMVHSHANICML